MAESFNFDWSSFLSMAVVVAAIAAVVFFFSLSWGGIILVLSFFFIASFAVAGGFNRELTAIQYVRFIGRIAAVTVLFLLTRYLVGDFFKIPFPSKLLDLSLLGFGLMSVAGWELGDWGRKLTTWLYSVMFVMSLGLAVLRTAFPIATSRFAGWGPQVDRLIGDLIPTKLTYGWLGAVAVIGGIIFLSFSKGEKNPGKYILGWAVLLLFIWAIVSLAKGRIFPIG